MRVDRCAVTGRPLQKETPREGWGGQAERQSTIKRRLSMITSTYLREIGRFRLGYIYHHSSYT